MHQFFYVHMKKITYDLLSLLLQGGGSLQFLSLSLSLFFFLQY
jgi:hypothetical protein